MDAQAHARAAAVAGRDEFDAGVRKSPAELGHGGGPPAQQAVLGFEPLDGHKRHLADESQILLRPRQICGETILPDMWPTPLGCSPSALCAKPGTRPQSQR